MNKSYPFAEVQEKINRVQKVLVALPANPKYEQVAGALSLYLSLQQAGKSVSLVCSSPMTVEFSNLVGVDRISQKIKGTDLIVTLNYSMDNVEKISYNDDNGKLNLVVQPKNGAPELSEKSVSFSSAGVGAELLITVGVKNLGSLNASWTSSVGPENIINIDNKPDNTNFAAINVIDMDASSLPEVIFGLLSGTGLPMDADVGQNILNGVWRVTGGLHRQEAGPDAYETVAGCLRLGAQKPQESAVAGQGQLKPQPKVWPAEVERKTQDRKDTQPRQNPPSDWFEPKIYRGSNTV